MLATLKLLKYNKFPYSVNVASHIIFYVVTLATLVVKKVPINTILVQCGNYFILHLAFIFFTLSLSSSFLNV